jgi:glycosyltransferase involved in cell wall biosynthesis
MSADLAVIILTFNEEENIEQCLRSVCGWAREVHIIDSFSTDRTLEIARRFQCAAVKHSFENYADQRNWALDNLPIQGEWVLFLDADEWLPETLKEEMAGVIASNPEENGFYVKRRFIWMGRWIKRGYYPTWILRLFRKGKGRCEQRAVNEHLIVEGETGQLKNDFIHEDRKGLAEWTEKHNRYSTLEAERLFRGRGEKEIEARFSGSQAERKRWLRYRLYNRLPPLVRPFLYFFYRYVLRGGFLDGREAFLYHFLHALWVPLLVDAKYLEMARSRTAVNGGEAPAGGASCEQRVRGTAKL